MTQEFEREVIDRLARIETNGQHTAQTMTEYKNELDAVRKDVDIMKNKIYGVSAVVGVIATVLTIIGTKLTGN